MPSKLFFIILLIGLQGCAIISDLRSIPCRPIINIHRIEDKMTGEVKKEATTVGIKCKAHFLEK